MGHASKAVPRRWHRSGDLNEKEQLNKEHREEYLGGRNSHHRGSESTGSTHQSELFSSTQDASWLHEDGGADFHSSET